MLRRRYCASPECSGPEPLQFFRGDATQPRSPGPQHHPKGRGQADTDPRSKEYPNARDLER